MPDWLQQSIVQPDLTHAEIAWRLFMSLVLGGVVSGIYHITHRNEPIAPSFPRTLVLLSILIAMVVQVIGGVIAHAFTLTGALAIIRFRTVVRDTQDTAFVIFAVIVGMAAGLNHLMVALIGSVIVIIAILIMRPRGQAGGWADQECDLVVRVPAGSKSDDILAEAFKQHVRSYEIRSIGTAQKGTALEVAYRLRLREGVRPFNLIATLNQIDGVLGVELKRAESE